MIYEEFPPVDIVSGNIINEQEIKTNNHEQIHLLDELEMVHEASQISTAHTDSFVEDIRSLESRLTSSNESERDAFVEMMYKFEKLFTPKLGSADTFH